MPSCGNGCVYCCGTNCSLLPAVTRQACATGSGEGGARRATAYRAKMCSGRRVADRCRLASCPPMGYEAQVAGLQVRRSVPESGGMSGPVVCGSVVSFAFRPFPAEFQRRCAKLEDRRRSLGYSCRGEFSAIGPEVPIIYFETSHDEPATTTTHSEACGKRGPFVRESEAPALIGDGPTTEGAASRPCNIGCHCETRRDWRTAPYMRE